MKVSIWYKRAKAKLLKLSQSTIFKDAMREWKFTWLVVDHGAPIETCQLCGHPDVRYHYEIFNATTDEVLQVGSECIKKFGSIIVVDDDGHEILDPIKRAKRLDEILKLLRVEAMLKPLRELYRLSNEVTKNFILRAVNYFKSKKGFAPRDLEQLFRGMTDAGVSFHPKTYKVALRSWDDRGQLRHMDSEGLQLIFQAMSKSQKEKYRHLLKPD